MLAALDFCDEGTLPSDLAWIPAYNRKRKYVLTVMSMVTWDDSVILLILVTIMTNADRRVRLCLVSHPGLL
jgi:hypothetical protein